MGPSAKRGWSKLSRRVTASESIDRSIVALRDIVKHVFRRDGELSPRPPVPETPTNNGIEMFRVAREADHGVHHTHTVRILAHMASTGTVI